MSKERKEEKRAVTLYKNNSRVRGNLKRLHIYQRLSVFETECKKSATIIIIYRSIQ